MYHISIISVLLSFLGSTSYNEYYLPSNNLEKQLGKLYLIILIEVIYIWRTG